MSIFFEALKNHLEEQGSSIHALSFDARIQSGVMYSWGKGKRRPSDNDLIKIANCDKLGLDLYQLQAWRLLDEYPPEAIVKAYEIWKEGIEND